MLAVAFVVLLSTHSVGLVARACRVQNISMDAVMNGLECLQSQKVNSSDRIRVQRILDERQIANGIRLGELDML